MYCTTWRVWRLGYAKLVRSYRLRRPLGIQPQVELFNTDEVDSHFITRNEDPRISIRRLIFHCVFAVFIASIICNGCPKTSFTGPLSVIQRHTFDSHRSVNNLKIQSTDLRTTILIKCPNMGRHRSNSIKRTGDRPYGCTRCSNRVSRTVNRVAEATKTRHQVGNRGVTTEQRIQHVCLLTSGLLRRHESRANSHLVRNFICDWTASRSTTTRSATWS
jgi:hypothetical protein